MPLRAILFDHDGTLVDSEPEHFRMWVSVLAPHGVRLSEEQYVTHYAGVPNRASAVDLVSRFELAVDAATLTEAKNAAAREFLSRGAYPLMPGALEAVDEFRRAGLVLAVVTGASANGVRTTLRANDLERHFATVVSGDDVRASKPAPDCYLLALERLGLSAADCLALEDTQHGLQAARGAGIRCLALPTALSKRHDFGGAEAVVEGMSEAVKYVRTLLGHG
ncbi:MAG TPA: HAD family phosphatase [Steroidobacteraceae bacterium]|nr:HAD family phosphatase [Steroidobacteraceae bacterium]